MTALSWYLTLIGQALHWAAKRQQRITQAETPSALDCQSLGEGAPLPPATPEDSSSEQEPSASRFLLSKKLYACQQRSEAAASGKASQYSAQSSPVSARCLRSLLQAHPSLACTVNSCSPGYLQAQSAAAASPAQSGASPDSSDSACSNKFTGASLSSAEPDSVWKGTCMRSRMAALFSDSSARSTFFLDRSRCTPQAKQLIWCLCRTSRLKTPKSTVAWRRSAYRQKKLSYALQWYRRSTQNLQPKGKLEALPDFEAMGIASTSLAAAGTAWPGKHPWAPLRGWRLNILCRGLAAAEQARVQATLYTHSSHNQRHSSLLAIKADSSTCTDSPLLLTEWTSVNMNIWVPD